VALINVNLEEAARLARKNGIQFSGPEELVESDDFRAIVDRHVEERNSDLAKYETIKYYHIINHAFSEETGELTPSLKVKRKVVMEIHRDIVDSMYPQE